MSEAFVADAIFKATGRTGQYIRMPRALGCLQDLYIVGGRSGRQPGPAFTHQPYGHLDVVAWVDDHHFKLSGWACDYNTDHEIDRVEVYVNGDLVGITGTKHATPSIVEHSRIFVDHDVQRYANSGWSMDIKLKGQIRPFSDILLAKAVSTSGQEFVCRCGSLRNLLHLS